jgi:hypothetical protein
MTLRNWMNLLEMTRNDALRVFKNLGVDTTELDPAGLKSAYRRLMMSNHPDKGGDLATAQNLAAAYDELKDGSKASSNDYEPEWGTGGFNSQPGRTKEQAKAEFSMDRPNFINLDYVKWYFETLSAGKPSQQYTVMAFDGHFFRGMFTVAGSHSLFTKMAKVMCQWDRHYKTRAVFVATSKMMEQGYMWLVWSDDYVHDPVITLNYDSMNSNPANDQQFGRQLPAILDAIEDGSFVSQNMM